MKVLFLKDVPSVGRRGAVKEVSDGYARNYLLPHQLAVAATPERLRAMVEEKVHQERDQERRLKLIGKLQRRLQGQRFTISAPANDQGTLFKGVTAKDVSAILRASGHEIEPGMINLPHALKQVGEQLVSIQLGSVGEVVIKLIIQKT